MNPNRDPHPKLRQVRLVQPLLPLRSQNGVELSEPKRTQMIELIAELLKQIVTKELLTDGRSCER